MLEVKNIKKSFKENLVLNGIDLKLEKGEVYGLIGKNGAGKTTLMNIIAQELLPDCGDVFIDGKKISCQNDLSGRLAYVIDIPAVFEYMTANEYLSFLLSPKNLSKDEIDQRIDEVLKIVNLFDVKDKRIKKFSRGMKQRLGIAGGIIIDSEILILDEPSSALDPEGRYEVLVIIKKLKNKGKTILLSTHILNDIERVCDRMGILLDGKIVKEGAIQDIVSDGNDRMFVVECDDESKANIEKYLKENKIKATTKIEGFSIEIEFQNKEDLDRFKKVVFTKFNATGAFIKKNTVEDLFLEVNVKEGK